MVPFNLSVMENGIGSLNVSWSHATIEGVEVEFTLVGTNLNDSNTALILVTGIEDLHWTLAIPDNTSCDVYSFLITARNDAGSSDPGDSITSTFPALPNISALEESLEHSLRKMDDGIMLNITLTVRWHFIKGHFGPRHYFCPHNYCCLLAHFGRFRRALRLECIP